MLRIIMSAYLSLAAFTWSLEVTEGADAPSDLEPKLLAVMMVNVQGLRDENMERCLTAFHVDGPGRKNAEASMRQLFPVTDFEYEPRGFKLLGVDDEFAVARFQQHTKLVGESKIPLKNKESDMDMLMVYKKNGDGEWKIWTSTMLKAEAK